MWAKCRVIGLVGLLGVSVGASVTRGTGNPQEQASPGDVQKEEKDGARDGSEAARKAPDEQGNKRPEASIDRSEAGGRGVNSSEFFYGSHSGLTGMGKDFLQDQKQIWTSPARVRISDADWLVPMGGFAAGLFATDSAVSRHLSKDPATINHAKTISLAGVGALAGAAGGMWLLSYPEHREHLRENGLLAGEAGIESFLGVEKLE